MKSEYSVAVTEMLARLLVREGGTSNQEHDAGGLTRYGITKYSLKEYYDKFPKEKKVKLEKITKELATEIYYQLYYLLPKFDALIPNLQELMLDSGVLYGRGTASKWLQGVVMVVPDGKIGPKTLAAVNSVPSPDIRKGILRERYRYTSELVVRKPTQLKFLNGWINRTSLFL